MNIALLTDGIYPYVPGGMQKHSYYLAKYMALQGVNVTLFHFKQNAGHDPFTDEEKKHIQFHELEFPTKPKLPGHYIRESYAYSCAIHELLKPSISDYDFIYAQGFTGWKTMDEAALHSYPPIGVNFHGLNMFQQSPSLKDRLKQKSLVKAVKHQLTHANYNFSLGGRLTEILKEVTGREDNIIQVPTGVEQKWLTDKPRATEEKRKFIFIGRYDRLKGVEEINRAIAQLPPEGNYEFGFIGPIPDKVRLKSTQVVYYGELKQENEVKRILTEYDVLLCPSYSEGMPTVIHEAMARGLAIIATDVGAISEQIEGNGWLIKHPTNVQSAIEQALATPTEQIDQLKHQSLEMVRSKFLWENTITTLLEKIEHVIN